MITVTIKTENAAFGDQPEAETARILRDIADKLELRGLSDIWAVDGNGNTVGGLSVSED